MPDQICRGFESLAAYDYRSPSETDDLEGATKLVDVDILGHIFEQSITDLELLHFELEGLLQPEDRQKSASRRKKEGAFYTPPFITRYIVGQALGSVLTDKFETLRKKHAAAFSGRVLDDPRAYILKDLKAPQRSALIQFWEAWPDELAGVRILDPSCGSGAFLIESFEQLYQAYQRSNDYLEELRGNRTLFDLDRQILQQNLYGVDLNEEAIEICRLSLWIKTAQRGKALTSLDHNIRVGNSVIADPAAHPRAFDWQSAFPEVFKQSGFDVVVGNPPYIRQEWIAPYKPYFQQNYKTYHGVADIYVYFYELGVRVLRPGGRLSFVVTNKWLKAAYGEPLRRFFAENAWVESLVDFGHAKQIFPDADVFPSIIVARKPNVEPPPRTVKVCAIPREQLRIFDLAVQIKAEGVDVERDRLGAETWSLEPKAVYSLLTKIAERGVSIAEFAGVKPTAGFATGLNEAFVIDTSTRIALIASHPNCSEIIKPYLRGQDIFRWVPERPGLWIIFARRGINIDAYPSVRNHLERYQDKLKPKTTDSPKDNWSGRKAGAYKWYELQDSVDYWRLFESPKIIYPDITWTASFCIDDLGTYGSKTMYFLPTADLWILAVLNSSIAWWFAWRKALHGKDEALRFHNPLMESFPIPRPTFQQRTFSEIATQRIIEITKANRATLRNTLDWLRIEYEIDKPSARIRSTVELDSDAFIAEVKKIRGKKKPLTLAALRSLREEHANTILPAQALALEARKLEHQISDLVNQAYGLTPEEIQLMWDTAPPRMPISPNPL